MVRAAVEVIADSRPTAGASLTPMPVLELDRVGVVIGPGCRQCADARGRRCAACATTRALQDVTFDVLPGEVVGVWGPSGAGKSTLLRVVTGVQRPTGGTVWVSGSIHDGTMHVLAADGLASGIRQARAGDDVLTAEIFGVGDPPSVLVVDDPTVGHDPSMQATLVDLLDRLASLGPWGTVITSSDAGVLRVLADRVVVLDDGRVVAAGLVEEILGTEGTVPW